MILNFLFEKAEISLDAMTEVFKHVTESREVWLKSHDATPFRRSEDRIGIIKFLCNTGCIPSGMIDTAFVRAATNGYVNVMAALHDAQGLNTMTINKALICASYHDHASIVNMLSTKPGLSTKMVARALETAASRGNVGVVKALCGKQQLPSELLAKIVEEEAMDGGSTRLIEALYDRQYLYVDPIADGLVNAALLRISWVNAICNEKMILPEILGEVFLKAAGRGCLGIVELLFPKPCITFAQKHEGFIAASRHGHSSVICLFDIKAKWSLETLNQSIESHETPRHSPLFCAKRLALLQLAGSLLFQGNGESSKIGELVVDSS